MLAPSAILRAPLALPCPLPQAYGPAAFTVGLTSGQRKQIAAWLTVCAGWVFALVCIGGATRLTRSGLSMTDWKFTGEHRPQNQVGAYCVCVWFRQAVH